MTKLNLNIDYKVPAKEKVEDFSPVSLTVNYILFAVKQKYPEGLQGQLRRVWGRINRKLDAASEENAVTEIELEASEVDFIKGVFTESVKFPAAASKYVMELEDVISKL